MERDQSKLSLKEKLYIIIFESNTPAGKAFDITLLWLILISIVLICMESVPWIHTLYASYINVIEWVITIIFTLEYFTRILIVKNKRKYVTSFFGLVDLLSIVPMYLSFVVPGAEYALVLRIFRLLRVFRVLKMGRFMGESYVLLNALKASRYKITVFLEGVLIVVVLNGTIMYLIEGEAGGFDSIPSSIYWAIVTLTTVGFGDITPVTPLGRAVASFLMLLGYGVIAVPTGIVTSELTRSSRVKTEETKECSECEALINDSSAEYCKFCGTKL